MARKLKVFQTSLGFFDQAIAAPSMKAALEAWGADSNLFHQGAAKETTDPEIVAATMAKPGVVLKRPVGSDGTFKEHADLPANLGHEGPNGLPRKRSAKPKKKPAGKTDDKAARKAASEYEKEERATEDNYPPYNIERLDDDRYQISLAVAGFSPDEISVTAEQNVVTIEGNKPEKAERQFIYRGISTRHFKRQFNLADYVQVKDASFDNGLLKIELVREIPEAMKPRRIAINGASTSDNVHQIEAKAA